MMNGDRPRLAGRQPQPLFRPPPASRFMVPGYALFTPQIVPRPANMDPAPAMPQHGLSEIQEPSRTRHHELLSTMQSIVGSKTPTEDLEILLLGAGDNLHIALNHWAQRQESRSSSGSTSPSLDEVSPLERVICEVEEEIECQICQAYFTNPVSLSCLHTFCLACVEPLVQEESVKCPVCEYETDLDERGVDGLNQNHYLANIVGMLKNAPTRKCARCLKMTVSAFCKHQAVHVLRLRRQDPLGAGQRGSSRSQLQARGEKLYE